MLRDNPYKGRINARRKIAFLPTIFEVVNEEKATPSCTVETRLPSKQRFEYERESKERCDNAEVVMCKKPRRNFLFMDIETTKRTLGQCNTHIRTAYPEFFPRYQRMTCCGDNISIQSIRAYHKNACSGLKPAKRGEKQDTFEKQRGIAAWLKFFG